MSSEVPIEIVADIANECASFRTITLRTDHGELKATYDSHIGMLSIGWMDVDSDFRRKGIAKSLLRHALSIAVEWDAKDVFASMISKESIDAMVTVFGEESVHIMNPGTYAPETNPDHHNADAVLLYQIPRSTLINLW